MMFDAFQEISWLACLCIIFVLALSKQGGSDHSGDTFIIMRQAEGQDLVDAANVVVNLATMRPGEHAILARGASLTTVGGDEPSATAAASPFTFSPDPTLPVPSCASTCLSPPLIAKPGHCEDPNHDVSNSCVCLSAPHAIKLGISACVLSACGHGITVASTVPTGLASSLASDVASATLFYDGYCLDMFGGKAIVSALDQERKASSAAHENITTVAAATAETLSTLLEDTQSPATTPDRPAVVPTSVATTVQGEITPTIIPASPLPSSARCKCVIYTQSVTSNAP
ncbi:uncharacterized protein E0L32_008629 [Thyridium curvatum]|uniref:Extracellular membrane protein CFEM domain-containing protein n=1 Tax=Thyridium curvatum TaxID=1093900 RepID=A0A507B1I1_9PEZI|nr:uncharacterized protein E0L32_008629 [Thyridium curvatum]TPX10410.1 hypothetical protein E0L32_008629 [Thyridium curvatum]